MLVLRDYQQEARAKSRAALARADAALTVMPTGSGKSLVGAAVARDTVDAGGRVLILCHRKELISQWQKACDNFGLTWAVEQAENKARKDTLFGRVDVVIGSKDTMQGKRLELWNPNTFQLVIADEVHRAIAKTWMKVFAHFHKAKRLGLTATPERTDDESIQPVFGDLAYELKFWTAVDRGILKAPLFRRPDVHLDLEPLRTSGDDLNQGDLEDLISRSVSDLVAGALPWLDDRPIMTFTPRVFSATAMADGFRGRGISSCSVAGSSDDRDDIVRLFRAESFRNLCSCDLYREGADFPAVANIALARPTKSGLVFRQILGRALRLREGETRCYANIIDYAWNSGRHDLFRPIDLFDASDMDLDILKLAAGLIEGGEADPRKALAEADRVHRRQVALKVTVKEKTPSYRMLAYDPFQVGSLLGIPNRQRDGMKPITAKNKARLGAYKLDPGAIADAQARRLLKELERRRAGGLASHRQVACLVANGVPQDRAREMRFEEARDDLDILIGERRGA